MAVNERINVLKDITMFQPDFTIWSGAKKLEASDFVHINTQDLPPHIAASLGEKKLIDPKRLVVLTKYRGQADRLCRSAGVQFAGCYAVPNSEAKSISRKLRVLCDNFQADLDDFVTNYPAYVKEWADELRREDPDFAEVVWQAQIPHSEIERRFKCNLNIFQISASPLDTSASMSNSAGDLRSQVLKVVVSELADTVRKLNEMPNGVFKNPVRGRLKTTGDRLKKFAFCDHLGVFAAFADKLASFKNNGEGPIQDIEYHNLRCLIGSVVDVRSLDEAMAPIPLDIPNLDDLSAAPSPSLPVDDATPQTDQASSEVCPAEELKDAPQQPDQAASNHDDERQDETVSASAESVSSDPAPVAVEDNKSETPALSEEAPTESTPDDVDPEPAHPDTPSQETEEAVPDARQSTPVPTAESEIETPAAAIVAARPQSKPCLLDW